MNNKNKEKYNFLRKINYMITVVALLFAPYGVYCMHVQVESHLTNFLIILGGILAFILIAVDQQSKKYVEKIVFKKEKFEDFLK